VGNVRIIHQETGKKISKILGQFDMLEILNVYSILKIIGGVSDFSQKPTILQAFSIEKNLIFKLTLGSIHFTGNHFCCEFIKIYILC